MGNSPAKGEGEKLAEDAPKEPGMFAQLSLGYDQLVNAIIRPPRAQYEIQHLGPREFTFCGEIWLLIGG